MTAVLARLEKTAVSLRDELERLNSEHARLVGEEAATLEDEIRLQPAKPVNRQPGSRLYELAKKIETTCKRRDAVERELRVREVVYTQERERESAELAATTAAAAVDKFKQAEESLTVKADELLAEWGAYLEAIEEIDDNPYAAAAVGRVYADLLVWFSDLFRDQPEKRPREPFIRRLDKVTTGTGMRFAD